MCARQHGHTYRGRWEVAANALVHEYSGCNTGIRKIKIKININNANKKGLLEIWNIPLHDAWFNTVC